MWEELRRCEKRWEDIRRADMSCGELRRVEKNCENLRKAGISWDEMRRGEKSSGWHEKRWEQLWSAEKSWEGREDMTWDEMRWGKKNWEDMRGDELRWDGMTQTAVTVGCNEQFPREAAMQWDQMKWEETQHSKGMASDWQTKSLLLRSQEACLVTYRHSLCSALKAISVSILKLPPPACPGTTCMMGCGVVRVLLTLLPPSCPMWQPTRWWERWQKVARSAWETPIDCRSREGWSPLQLFGNMSRFNRWMTDKSACPLAILSCIRHAVVCTCTLAVDSQIAWKSYEHQAFLCEDFTVYGEECKFGGRNPWGAGTAGSVWSEVQTEDTTHQTANTPGYWIRQIIFFTIFVLRILDMNHWTQ